MLWGVFQFSIALEQTPPELSGLKQQWCYFSWWCRSGMWAASKFTDHLLHMVSAEHRNCQKIRRGLLTLLAGGAGYGLEVQAEPLRCFTWPFHWLLGLLPSVVLGCKTEYFRSRHFWFLRTQSHKMQTFTSDLSNPHSVSQSQPSYKLPVIKSCQADVKCRIGSVLIVNSFAITVYGARWVLDLPGWMLCKVCKCLITLLYTEN